MSESTADASPQNVNPFNGKSFGDTDSLYASPGWGIRNDGFGLLESTISIRTSQDNKDALPRKGDTHPRDERLFLYRKEVNKVAAGLIEVRLEYAGIEQTDRTEVRLSISSSSSTDPIETHPNFAEKIGGKPSAPLNGAVFIDPASNLPTSDDKVGVFTEFSTLAETNATGDPAGEGEEKEQRQNKFAGVKSFYNPGISLKGEFFCKDLSIAASTLASIGKTSVSGKWSGVELIPIWGMEAIGPALNASGYEFYNDQVLQRNLLLNSAGIEQFGTIYKVSYEITMSGGRGWLEEIYPSAESTS